MAGNIPLVGFHDMLCVLMCGHKAVLKMSSQDNILIPLIIHELICIEPKFKPFIQFLDDMKGKDFVFTELPGLWNGSMHYWHTTFVEIPSSSFTPVKNFTDLFLSIHQP